MRTQVFASARRTISACDALCDDTCPDRASANGLVKPTSSVTPSRWLHRAHWQRDPREMGFARLCFRVPSDASPKEGQY